MLVLTMNASFTPTHPSLNTSAGSSVPPKEPTDASISRSISASSPSGTEKTNTDVFDDRKSTYRDFSHITDTSTTDSRKSTNKESTFPVKLHKILSSQQFRHVITWLPHGRAWKILDHEVFEDQVLPLFFNHGRYTSFARQVSGWGFKRVQHGNDMNAYYHEVSSLVACLHVC